MKNGWIKLHRKLLENPFANKPKYLSLWITLLLKANHEGNKIMWNGEVLVIKEGQILTGRKELSKQVGIPESTLEDILNLLEKQHQIRQQKTTKFRLITVINWKEYQKGDITSDNKATTKQQQSDTYKNDKNVKNDKNNNSAPSAPIGNGPLKESFKWQLEALEAIKLLQAKKKSSIFKCFKDNPGKARIALLDCKELGKLNELYFFKVYSELKK